MDTHPPRGRHAPWITLALLTLALLAQLRPELAAAWQLDLRPGAGAAWRLATGHLTHWSWNHLLWDGALFLLLGARLEARGRAAYVLLLTLAAIVVSLGLPHWEPSLHLYRGLSGVASALFTAWATACWLDRDRRTSRFAGAALLAFLAKLLWETASGHPLFVDPAGTFRVLPSAHVLGAVTGLAWALRTPLARPTTAQLSAW